MDVTAELDDLRAVSSGCEIVALVDLTTRSVLASSAGAPPTQERLDSLSHRAAASLAGPVAEGAALLFRDDAMPQKALVATRGAVDLFVGDPTGDEAIALVTRDGADLPRLSEGARDLLGRLSARS